MVLLTRLEAEADESSKSVKLDNTVMSADQVVCRRLGERMPGFNKFHAVKATTRKSLLPASPPCKKPCPIARSNGTIRQKAWSARPRKLAYLDPAFQQWVKATQALPAEKQIEAVSKKLMELNPGFDGKVTG